MAGGPEGIVLSHAAGPEAVQQLAAEIYELEQRNQIVSGSMKIVPQVADTARAALTIDAYLDVTHPRLAGLVWSSAALATALGATRTRDESGEWSDVCRQIRAQTLLTARAREILALELLDSAEEDAAAVAKAARADGFAGMFASHPAQVAAINQAYGAPVAEPVAAQTRRMAAALG
jgi:citrate lyase subunit beta/citryl-CoA lyase